jgi:unsaturated rhamnogalacturonyl hydrolase
MLTTYLDNFASAYRPYKGGAWCYEDGCIYRGLVLLHQATGEARWYDHLKRLVDAQVSGDGALKGYSVNEFNIDNILSGRALFYLHDATGEEKYLTAAKLLGEQLASHPRTESGVYWHKNVYPWQIWLDGLYMGLPFQIELAQSIGAPKLIDDALSQLKTALHFTYKRETELYVHGYDESGQQAWADPLTGQSPAHWARALGWLSMALVDVIDLVGPKHAEEFGIVSQTNSLLETIISLRTPTATWLQVIDMPSLPGNYEESSASAMLSYAILKADRLGVLSGHQKIGEESFDKLVEQAVLPDGRGGHEFVRICHVAGLGGHGGRYRDGTPGYYLTEDVVADDSKGVGPLMMATAEKVMAAEARTPVRGVG